MHWRHLDEVMQLVTKVQMVAQGNLDDKDSDLIKSNETGKVTKLNDIVKGKSEEKRVEDH